MDGAVSGLSGWLATQHKGKVWSGCEPCLVRAKGNKTSKATRASSPGKMRLNTGNDKMRMKSRKRNKREKTNTQSIRLPEEGGREGIKGNSSRWRSMINSELTLTLTLTLTNRTRTDQDRPGQTGQTPNNQR
ncbi:uncharacterized protein TRIVIDRAFT_216710 [Trichoderma virens Gv29-8]|uniref:Uncharacterized protein n=1 Tax=Hypocrea virens (strain Gv29-8 / FGSC 10586) TaxID=413071 RepID=G9N4R0_HYPVG|nr:uncharacterized protein TRIVIDRAFT_216710 [Trichoderma virens Gv29-8]EHK18584.1 hypothetical protein TRIVIDRAFT_216710 [Trichoderma virens Gv29-8]